MSINQQQQSYYPNQAGNRAAVDAPNAVAERSQFIERTYLHLAGAIAAFVGLEYAFLNSDAVLNLASVLFRFSPFLMLGLFTGISMLAEYFARHATSRPMQYLGLGLYVVLMAFFSIRLVALGVEFGGPDLIMTAAVSTLAIFAALTGIVMVTKRDFSWMRGSLMVLSLAALGVIGFSLAFGFSLGILFTVCMIALSACYILYDTSNVMRHYPPQAYVAASLALFSSVVMMFWYVLRFLLQMSRD